MTDCADFGATCQLLFDGELAGEDLDEARAHLQTCSACRQRFEEEEILSQMIRQALPPQRAPASLRDRVLKITAEASPAGKQQSNDTRHLASTPIPNRQRASSTVLIRQRVALIAAILLITLGAVLFPHLRSRSLANSFVDTAILADRGLSTHTLPLDVQSSSPKEVAAWFDGKVPFRFRMPNAGIAADSNANYTLVGGRLLPFSGEQIALVNFRLSGENISLLVAPDRLAKATGGTVAESNGLSFHSRQQENRNIVTWDNQGLTYALIFPPAASEKHTCAACHESSTGSGQPLDSSAHLSQIF
jgi:mycothiol system anti-sigma-R factor